MLPDSWPLWAQLVVGAGAVCAALTAIGVFLARTGRGVRRAAEWIGGIVEDRIVKVLDESPSALSRDEVSEIVTSVVEAKIAPIHAEVRPNGGASLKDQVTRLETLLTDHIQASSLDRADLRRWLEHVDPGRTTDRRHPPEEHP